MKFKDGYWLLRRGVQASYARQAYHVRRHGSGLRVLAPATSVHTRGDMLRGPVLTVEASSPM